MRAIHSRRKVLYVGDVDEKWMVFDEQGFRKLEIRVDAHGKMPDAGKSTSRQRLAAIEGAVSHGPIDPKRQQNSKSISPKANRMDQNANAQLAHRLQNHRSADRWQLASLSARKFAQRASRWEAESQPLPYLLFAGSLNSS